MTPDVIATLAAADPARELAPTPAEAARMDAELRRLTATPSPIRRQRRMRWLALPLALGVIVAALALALPSSGPPTLQPAPASAASVLTQLGRTVASAPAGTGRYGYVKQVSYVSHMRPRPQGKGSYVVVLPHEDELWLAADGTAIARSVIDESKPRFPTEGDRADYEAETQAQPPWDSRPHRVRELTVVGLTPAEVSSLPTDPQALRARLEARDVAVTALAGQLLVSPLASRELKVALYEVLKGLPGARLVGDVTVPGGRRGVGVEFDDAAWRTLFVFDTRDGALLGTRSIGKQELPGRTIEDWTVVVEAGRRDDAPGTVR